MVKLRPSSLPALKLSPRFEPEKGGEAAVLGSDRHAALEGLLNGNRSMLELLRDEDIAGVEWAKDYIVSHAPMEDHPLISERLFELFRDGKFVLQGTVDVLCGDNIFDLKWRRRDYSAQMAAYALAVMQARKSEAVQVHVLYADSQQSEVYTLFKHQAEAIVWPIVDEVLEPSTVCRASDYCSWCKLKTTCPVLHGAVLQVTQMLELVAPDRLDLVSPESIAYNLQAAEAVIIWGTEIKSKATELSRDGLEIPGYRRVERVGLREVPSHQINAAFQLLEFPMQTFMDACKLNITTLEAGATQFLGLSKRDAKDYINNKLHSIIERKQSVTYLKKVK